jgi:hypothetical protein
VTEVLLGLVVEQQLLALKRAPQTALEQQSFNRLGPDVPEVEAKAVSAFFLQNSRPSAAGNAASGSRNQRTSIPRGIGPKARNGFFFRLPPFPQPRALASLAPGVFFCALSRSVARRGV